MKAFRGDVGTGFPSTPAPMGYERGTGWTANQTPESVHSLSATPLYHSVTRSIRSTPTVGSIGTPGIISHDGIHVLEIFAPFPSVVTDTLRRLPSFDASHLSGNLDVSSGYAWIVMNDVNFKSNRKLLLWNYQLGGSSMQATRTRPGASGEVFQFLMPGAVGERAPSANLVCIAASLDAPTSAGVIAISPYGLLRYWPRITESSRCTDVTIALATDETCDCISPLPMPGMFALGTSTGRLILVSCQGSHSIQQREIRATKSVLRTVGSWFGLGAKPASATDSDVQLVGLRITPYSNSALVWLLTTSALSVWHLDARGTETLICNTNITAEFETLLYEEQEQLIGGHVNLNMTVCDFQVQLPNNTGLLTLLIGAEPSEYQDENVSEQALEARGDKFEFYLVRFELNVTATSTSTGAKHISSIKTKIDSMVLLPEDVTGSQVFPSLNVSTNDSTSYVHWLRQAICAPCSNLIEYEMEFQDVTRNPAHHIFGSAATTDAALYFTPLHGIVKLQLLNSSNSDDTDQQMQVEVPQRKNTKRTSPTDVGAKNKVKPGYMAQAAAIDIISEAFIRYMSQSTSQFLSSPSLSYPWSSLVESLWKLDFEGATRQFSSQIIDSRPSEDPRWPELAGKSNLASYASGITSSNKSNDNYNSQLQALLYRQIEEKLDVHMNFVRFLVEVGIWSELSLETKDFLEQSSEKLAAASHLRAKHNELLQLHQTQQPIHGSHFSIFQQAIESALIARGISRAQWERMGLGAQDVFYAQVSMVESILEPTVSILKTQLSTNLSLESQLNLIAQANDICQSLFAAPIAHRTQYAKEFYLGALTSMRNENEEPTDQSLEFYRAHLAASDSSLGPAWTRDRHMLLREVIRIARQFAGQVQQTKAATASRALGKSFASSSFEVDLDTLNSQLFHMTDSLLSDWYQEILRCEQQAPQQVMEMKDTFSALRRELIMPMKLETSQHERALILAEKYQEFLVIIEVCQLKNDDRRLWSFAEQFVESGFDRVVFEYLFTNKQYYKLMTPPRAYWKSLRLYLEETPAAQKLAWQQMVRDHDLVASECTFDTLAFAETQSAFNQTTLLSLAKLSQLAHQPSHARSSQDSFSTRKLDEEREQRLYLRNAQLAIRAMFDHTDDDAAPASSQTLVARLLECALGNESVSPGYSLQLAMDLYRHTTLLRPESGNQELLKSIWTRILELEHWGDLANALQRGEIDDATLQENVAGSLFFNVAIHTEVIKEELPLPIFTLCVSKLYHDRATVRVLAQAFELVYRTKGVSPPDLTELTGSMESMQTDTTPVIQSESSEEEEMDQSNESAHEGTVEVISDDE